MRDPKDLAVSKRIRTLIKKIHKLSLNFPSFEKYELGSQLRRASCSMLLNLHEGNPSIYMKTYIKHLDSAICSGHEVRAILDLILDREYITSEQHTAMEEELKQIQYILIAIMSKVKKDIGAV
jgi:four helix bundle protein